MAPYVLLFYNFINYEETFNMLYYISAFSITQMQFVIQISPMTFQLLLANDFLALETLRTLHVCKSFKLIHFNTGQKILIITILFGTRNINTNTIQRDESVSILI